MKRDKHYLTGSVLKEVAYTQSFRPKKREAQGFAKFGDPKANLDLEMHKAMKPKQKYFYKKVKTIVEPNLTRTNPRYPPATFHQINNLKQNLVKKEELKEMFPESEQSIDKPVIVIKKSGNTLEPVFGGKFNKVRISLKPTSKEDKNTEESKQEKPNIKAEVKSDIRKEANQDMGEMDRIEHTRISAPKRFYSKVNANPMKKPNSPLISRQTILSQFMKPGNLSQKKVINTPQSDLSILTHKSNNTNTREKKTQHEPKERSSKKINIFQENQSQKYSRLAKRPSESNQSEIPKISEQAIPMRRTVIKMNEMNEIEIQKLTEKEIIASNFMESPRNKQIEMPKKSEPTTRYEQDWERREQEPEKEVFDIHMSQVGESGLAEEYRKDIEKVRKSGYGKVLRDKMRSSHRKQFYVADTSRFAFLYYYFIIIFLFEVFIFL